MTGGFGGGGDRRRAWRVVALAAGLVVALLGPFGRPAPLAAEESRCGMEPVATGIEQTTAVVVDGLRLRAGPGTDCSILDELPFGTVVTILGAPLAAGDKLWVPVGTPMGVGFTYTGGLEAFAAGPARVPVLIYHRISDAADDFAVSPDQLWAQLQWLSDNGYQTVTPSDLMAWWEQGAPLPARPVMLAIDDGFVSSLTFAEALAAYGFRGTYFLPNEAARRLTAGDIAWLASVGEVCGHTVHHADLATLSPGEQWSEVWDNKVWLEGITGAPVGCFAYPYGSYDWATVDIVASAGYAIAFDAWGGPAPLDGSFDRWHVPRILVPNALTLADLAAAVE